MTVVYKQTYSPLTANIRSTKIELVFEDRKDAVAYVREKNKNKRCRNSHYFIQTVKFIPFK
jgi:hypothetical protein